MKRCRAKQKKECQISDGNLGYVEWQRGERAMIRTALYDAPRMSHGYKTNGGRAADGARQEKTRPIHSAWHSFSLHCSLSWNCSPLCAASTECGIRPPLVTNSTVMYCRCGDIETRRPVRQVHRTTPPLAWAWRSGACKWGSEPPPRLCTRLTSVASASAPTCHRVAFSRRGRQPLHPLHPYAPRRP